MRPLLEINWWQLVNSYRWFREHGYLPEKLKGYIPYGLTKEKYVELFAYIMENVPEEKLKWLPKRFEQFYNWIFMDEHEGSRSGKESSFAEVVKNSRFGHSEGTQAYIIDQMLIEGRHSNYDIARAIGSTESRVRCHIFNLRRKFKDEVDVLSVRRGNHSVYYIKERKEERGPKHVSAYTGKNKEFKSKHRKPNIQTFEGT